MSSTSSRILLLFGAGPNIGEHTIRAFAAKGYKVALVSRSLNEADSTADQLHIKGDLSDPDSVVQAFTKLKSSFGVPSVVVYNAAALTMVEATNPLSLNLNDFQQDFVINTTSAFVAAQQAVLAFGQLPKSASKTFIYTGNILNLRTMAPFLCLGIGKAASAHIIETAALAYQDRGFKFYYADERTVDGEPARGGTVDGAEHGKLFVELAETASQGPWLQTFVKGIGYKHFA